MEYFEHEDLVNKQRAWIEMMLSWSPNLYHKKAKLCNHMNITIVNRKHTNSEIINM